MFNNMQELTEYIPGRIWLKEYPVHYAGCDFYSRMTVIRLSDSHIMLHSPCEIDEELKNQIQTLGTVSYIVAPGSYHFSYILSAQQAFPEAETFLCPGIERKAPDIKFDRMLGDKPEPRWEADFDQVLVRGSRFIQEVAFYHKPTRTLILVDLLENFTDLTPGVSRMLKFWFKIFFRMWNNPKPAPEYQLGWKDKAAAGKSLRRILDWQIDRIIIAHGDLIEERSVETLTKAWKVPLKG
jgi:hypothetical protein